MNLREVTNQLLFTPTRSEALSIFRIVFGLCMMYQIAYYIHIDFVEQFISGPEFLFKYPLLQSLPMLPAPMLQGLLYLLFIAAIMMTVGLFTGSAAIFFTLGFSYLSFADKTLFNNHIYLISLISLVLVFIKTSNHFTLSFWKKKSSKHVSFVPSWHLHILQFLIILVYFYGGITKLNSDWLQGMVTPFILQGMESNAIIKMIPSGLMAFLITYGSIIFDITIGFFLLYKPTRYYAIALAILFHFLNATILFDDIDIFPYLMIAATLILFASDKISSLIGTSKNPIEKAKKKVKKTKEPTSLLPTEWNKTKTLTTIGIGIFVFFHLLFPLRYHFFTTNPEWTGHGSRFSWRMKAQSKKIDSVVLKLYDGNQANPTTIDLASFLSSNQLRHLANDPYNIIQFSKYLKAKAIRTGRATNPIIKADYKVSMNGRPVQNWVDPDVDLTNISESSWAPYPWILPLVSN